MDLKADFEAAIARVNGLAHTPATDAMLELYGLFKQATVGDATGERPGALDFKGRAKYDAWTKRKGLDRDQAMQAYVAFAKTL